MPWPVIPPNYNLRYGFKDGAQLELFGPVPEHANAETQDDPVTGVTGVTGSASYAAESAISSSLALGDGRMGEQDPAQHHMEVPGQVNPDQCPDIHAMEDGSCHPGQSEWEAWNILVSPDGAQAYMASTGTGENEAEPS